MEKMRYVLRILIIAFVTNNAIAGQKISRNKLNHCIVTKNSINNYEPDVFQKTNNLLRAPGELPIYCGKKIIIKGRLLDQNCVPVTDAKIYLWQVGCDGKYPYSPLRAHTDAKLINAKNGSSFKGSGTATTNNLGEFTFITTMPGLLAHQKPHLNIRAEHYILGNLQTRLDLLHSNIIEYESNLDQALSNLINDLEIYDFTVVMSGKTSSRY